MAFAFAAPAKRVDPVSLQPCAVQRNAALVVAGGKKGRGAAAVVGAIFAARFRPDTLGGQWRGDGDHPAQRFGTPQRRLRAAQKLYPCRIVGAQRFERSEEHTSELQSLMRI